MVDVSPYSQALFEIAQDGHQEDAYLKALEELSKTWQDTPDLVLYLKHPKIERAQKRQILASIVPEDGLLQRFLFVCNAHDVAAYVPEIYTAYVNLYNQARNVEFVRVDSASELTEEERTRLKDVLSQKMNKTVELSVHVDPSLIAGLRVQTQQFVLDNTVVHRVEAMKEELKKE
ncbi:ATP synthase F1 subunit delta [Catenisphaera adipataccumulans]|jgi:F-type H+-transporting ATPase subunit delta|uniref:ATP synthase subunit delta n=1 Tax=Catenisphaera adipataccumulans TaxID=700500 RepID=A0A7W8FVN3_9FIRM|nr:ATP synthase F1 subunit delta [Catenisphaera adipataccumulans]MBB5182396.1 F-type H+-transporting ATPase subunit delta [Catenisphaera adipataccumulans]